MNQNINQSSLRDKFRLTTRVRCFYMLFIYQFPLILGIIMGRVRFRGMHCLHFQTEMKKNPVWAGAIAGFQSHDCDDTRNSDGGQGVKSAMDEMEESPYCTTLYAITRERYKQKIKHMLDLTFLMLWRGAIFQLNWNIFLQSRLWISATTSPYRHTLTLQSSETLHKQTII